MALEDKIGELITALNANTAALSKIGAAAKPAAAAAAGTANKPAAAAAANKPASKPAAPKAPTIDDIRAKFGGYLSTKDTAEREARKTQVQAINDYFGVAKATDLDPSLFAEALGYLAIYEAGGEPDYPTADGEGAAEDGDALV